MKHLFGFKVDDQRTVCSVLAQVPGFSKKSILYTCRILGVLPITPWEIVTDSQRRSLVSWVETHFSSFKVFGADYIREKRKALDDAIAVGGFRAFRLKNGLPVRGQNTKSNAKTARRRKVKLFMGAVEVLITRVRCTFNNTHVVVATKQGNVLVKLSGGSLNFKGSKRSAGIVGLQLGERAAISAIQKGRGRKTVLFISGFGKGRFSVLKGIVLGGFEVVAVYHVGKEPYNGCRKSKSRRVLPYFYGQVAELAESSSLENW